MSAIRLNFHNILGSVVVGALIIYWYLANYQVHHEERITWKTRDLIMPTEDVGNEKTMFIKMQFNDSKKGLHHANLFYHELGSRVSPAVIFLHDSQSTSDAWVSSGALKAAVRAGYRSIAIDLPGYGKSHHIPIRTPLPFWATLHEKLELDNPVVVATHVAGIYALPLLMEPRPDTCLDRISGFVAIGLLNTHTYSPARYHQCEVPSLLVHCANDTDLGLDSLGDLRNLANREISVIGNAKQGCQHDSADEFNQLLYNFLMNIQKSKHLEENTALDKV